MLGCRRGEEEQSKAWGGAGESVGCRTNLFLWETVTSQRGCAPCAGEQGWKERTQ